MVQKSFMVSSYLADSGNICCCLKTIDLGKVVYCFVSWFLLECV